MLEYWNNGLAPFGQIYACGEKREAGKPGLKDYHDYLKDLKKIVVIL